MLADNFLSRPTYWTPPLLSAEEEELLDRADKAKRELEQEAKDGSHVCAKCGADISDRPRATHCHACRRKYNNEYYQKNKLKWPGVTGKVVNAPRPPCVGCGADMEGEHGSAKWCKICRGMDDERRAEGA